MKKEIRWMKGIGRGEKNRTVSYDRYQLPRLVFRRPYLSFRATCPWDIQVFSAVYCMVTLQVQTLHCRFIYTSVQVSKLIRENISGPFN